jgi:hypothetical protein
MLKSDSDLKFVLVSVKYNHSPEPAFQDPPRGGEGC